MSLLGAFSAAATIYSVWKGSKSVEEKGEATASEARRVAAANKRLSYRDADVMEKMAAEEHYSDSMNMLLLHEQQLNVMKTITTSYGKSGVISSTGSALDVSAEAAENAEFNIQMVKYNRKKAYDHRIDLADRYRLLGDAGLRDASSYASAILSTAKDSATAIRISSIPTIYEAGKTAGWFSD